MKLAVVIPTLGRREQVARLIDYLAEQTRLPDALVVSAPDPSHVAVPESPAFPVRVIFGPKGSCAQRNTALADLGNRFGIITFFDDDFLPATDYLAGVVEAFVQNPTFGVVTGRVIRDGAATAGVDWPEALAALEFPDPQPPGPEVTDRFGAYGANMSVRASLMGGVRFDERLVLYGWQEDIDFTNRLRQAGRVVCLASLRGVHLGIKSGRVSGKRFGYSQVVNPVYLIHKGTMPAGYGLRLVSRNLAANIVRSLRPEPYVDRRGRLRGNVLGLLHLVLGRIEPEYAQQI